MATRAQASVVAAALWVLAAGCSRDPEREAPAAVVQMAPRDSIDAIWRVQEFRRLAAGGWVDLARAFTNDNPRHWQGTREGIGQPWDFASTTWDTISAGVQWSGTTREVTRRTAAGRQVYFLDSQGKITGVLDHAADTVGSTP